MTPPPPVSHIPYSDARFPLFITHFCSAFFEEEKNFFFLCVKAPVLWRKFCFFLTIYGDMYSIPGIFRNFDVRALRFPDIEIFILFSRHHQLPHRRGDQHGGRGHHRRQPQQLQPLGLQPGKISEPSSRYLILSVASIQISFLFSFVTENITNCFCKTFFGTTSGLCSFRK